MIRLVVGTAVVLLLSPLAASAHFRSLARTSQAAYYTPVTVYAVPRIVLYDPCPVYVAAPVPIFVPGPPPRNYAIPTPAGPSTSEPPLIPPVLPKIPPAQPSAATGITMPAVSESRYYDAYGVASSAASTPAGGRCAIAFWNLSDTDLTLVLGGQERSLPRGKRLTIDLDREFTWQVAGRQPRSERVAAADSALEIVIRR